MPNAEQNAPRKRGRPVGRTAQGEASRERLYQTAVELIAERGYEATTLRDVAQKAGVSPALLYKYFPSKRAVVLKVYDDLSAKYAIKAGEMKPGKWRDRFIFALRTSLDVLWPNRRMLSALFPIIISTASEGLFSPETAFSRRRVQEAFARAITEATDAPGTEVGAALGRLLYLVHLAIIQWWLLDKSPGQRATRGLLKLIEQTLPIASLVLRLGPIRRFVVSADELFLDALLWR